MRELRQDEINSIPGGAFRLLHPAYDRDVEMRKLVQERIKILKRELREFVKSLVRYWFKRKTAVSPTQFSAIGDAEVIFPVESDHVRLNILVRDLATLTRKREPADLSECYRAVNRFDRSLHLLKEVGAAIARANKVVEPRPLESIMRFKSERGNIGRSAEEFLKVVLQMRKGQCDPAHVDWDGFRELLLHYRNSDLKPGTRPLVSLEPRLWRSAGEPKWAACCVALEIELEDRLWWIRVGARTYSFRTWVELELEDATLLTQLERTFFPSTPLDVRLQWRNESQKAKAKLAAKLRKRRQREMS